MATYKHGIYNYEVPTSLVPMVTVAAPTVAFGTSVKGEENKPTLCHTLAEFTEAFGWSDDFETYTLCEVAYVHFQLYNVAPVIFVSVKSGHHSTKIDLTMTSLSAAVTLPANRPEDFALYANNTELKNPSVSGAAVEYTVTDTTVKLTAAGISAAKAAGLKDNSTSGLNIRGEMDFDVTTVTVDDFIGGYDDDLGINIGLECINEIFPRFGLIPGTLIAPRWSQNTPAAATLATKAAGVNGVFQAMAAVDVDSELAHEYSFVNDSKPTTRNNVILTWPMVSLGGKATCLSTHVAALMGKVDAEHSDIPYKSPSNEGLQCDQAVTIEGYEKFLGHAQANYLNSIGIVTALNFIGGWRCWGNRTSVYPGNADPKDSFIPCRRMMNWIANTLVTSFWSKIDMPINKRLVESVVDSAQIWLNGLVARGALVGGRIEFREDENPLTDLADGIIRFHVYVCPPTPAREIDFTMEMDVNYFSSLFA